MSGLIPFNRKNSIASHDDFYNMLDDFFTRGLAPIRNFERDTFKIDVQETDKEYLIEADLPGVKKEEISLDLEDEKLSISVNRQETTEKKDDNYVHKERFYSSMSRSIYLADAEADNIKAKLNNGVLTITITKQEKSSKSCKIDID